MEKVVCFVEGPVEKYLQDIDTSVAEVNLNKIILQVIV